MPAETGPEASSQTLSLEQIDSAPFQIPKSVKEELVAEASKRAAGAAQAERRRLAEMIRRANETVKSAHAKPSDAASSSAIAPNADSNESSQRTTVRSSVEGTAHAAQAQSPPMELARGRWRDAVWDFYERMTEVATWWRIIKVGSRWCSSFSPASFPAASRS